MAAAAAVVVKRTQKNYEFKGDYTPVSTMILSDVDEAPYPGLLLSSDLSWASSILKLSNKLSQNVGCRMKTTIPKSLLNCVYKTVIQPRIDYCIAVWRYQPNIRIDNAQRLQNRAARIVSGNYDWAVESTDIVKLLNWQTV